MKPALQFQLGRWNKMEQALARRVEGGETFAARGAPMAEGLSD